MKVPPIIKALVIDDDDDDLFLTCQFLQRIDTFKLEIDTERNYEAARTKILQQKHDIYFVDYYLGPETGVGLIRDSVAAGVDKPFILLTGQSERKIDLEATKAGAYDYLSKSEINTDSLERSLRYSLQRYFSFKATAESERRYREIFTKSNDIIFLLNKDFELVDFNPRMCTLLGYSHSELDRKSITTLFEKPEEAKTFQQGIELGDHGADSEIRLLTKSGDRKVFLASCSKIISHDGRGQYQAILYDYTNIKKSLSEQLLKEKIETTAKLVRSLAHEIRNPLTNINLSLHQLENTITEDLKMFTEIIKRNSKRINDLIGELMNLSNPVEHVAETMEVNKLVRSALSIAMDRINLKRVEIAEQLSPQDIYVQVDPMKMQMALLNIIINAVEAMESDCGQLTMETAVVEGWAVIRISDNGCGIPDEIIPHLFQPYFTRKKNGMGLGLATTHSVIQAHKGSIEVASAQDQGTTFTIKLRLAAPEELTQSVGAAAQSE